jgi:hypothetical protein
MTKLALFILLTAALIMTFNVNEFKVIKMKNEIVLVEN